MDTRNLDIAAPHHLEKGSAVDLFALQPGRITELIGVSGSGLTRLGLGMLADPSRTGAVVVVDTKGWISPEAAWETGVVAESLVIVRCNELALWSKVTAALLEGVPAVYAEVPAGVKDQDLRRLAALARARKAKVAFRSMGRGLPDGVSHLRLRAIGITWEGADHGHGRLKRRRLLLEASGRGVAGMKRRLEVDDGDRRVMAEVDDGDRRVMAEVVDGDRRVMAEVDDREVGSDEGTNTLRVVSNVVVDPARRATG